MKSKIDPTLSSCSREPPTCGLILDAVEQFRQDPQSFQLTNFVQRYEAPDRESREAFVEELERAIRLETLFGEFRRGGKARPRTHRKRKRQAP
jgi:hypothetical protein